MRESKCYISVACFHYGGSDLLRFGKFEVLITSQALLSQKQPIFMQNYNFVKNDVFVAKICKYTGNTFFSLTKCKVKVRS